MVKTQFFNVPSVLYEHRYCIQEHFEIISSRSFFFEGSASNKLVSLHYPSLNKAEPVHTFNNSCYSLVVTSSDVYTICGKDDSKVFEYGEYGENDKYSKRVVLPENVNLQFACSFMNNLFVFYS